MADGMKERLFETICTVINVLACCAPLLPYVCRSAFVSRARRYLMVKKRRKCDAKVARIDTLNTTRAYPSSRRYPSFVCTSTWDAFGVVDMISYCRVTVTTGSRSYAYRTVHRLVDRRVLHGKKSKNDRTNYRNRTRPLASLQQPSSPSHVHLVTPSVSSGAGVRGIG